MYRRVIVVAVLLIAIGGAGYYFIFRKPQLVRVSTATIAPVSEVVYATGTVEPVEWAKVVPLQRRRVVELCHCEGQKVTKGQILGRQDDSEESAGLKELDVRYQQLIRDRDRAEKGRIRSAADRQRQQSEAESGDRRPDHQRPAGAEAVEHAADQRDRPPMMSVNGRKEAPASVAEKPAT